MIPLKKRPKAPSPFLQLPLEIRFQIYSLLLEPLQYDNRAETRSYDLLRQNNKPALRRPFQRWRPYPYSTLPASAALSATNRQIHLEIATFVHTNSIDLTIMDDLFFSFSNNPMATAFLQARPWIINNTKKVTLQFTFFGEDFTIFQRDYKNDSIPKLRFVYPSERTREFYNLCARIIPRMKPLLPQQPNNLRAMANLLSTFPRLNQIELMFDHSDLFLTWTEPWDDLAALQKVGIEVVIQFINDKQLGELVKYFKTLGAKTLMIEEGQSEVELENWRGKRSEIDGSVGVKEWSGWPYRSSSSYLRSVNWRVISPDGKLSIPIRFRNGYRYFLV